jgi:uncharacterized protein
MGTQKKKHLKIVLDTNILVSALLFQGELAALVQLWKRGVFTPVISRDTFAEFKSVLSYPKFSLTRDEVDALINEEILPFFEVVTVTEHVHGACTDPHDNKFLSCALAASADYIVTGDKAFYSLKRYRSVKIVRAAEFLRLFA